MSLPPLRPSLTPCPGADQLAAFELGELVPQAEETVAEHVSHCSRCADVLRDLDESPSNLLSALRQPPPPEPFAAEAACRQLEEAAKALGWDSDGATVPNGAAGRLALDLAVPRQLRHYRLLEELGRGGMGIVFKARHVRLNQTVAVKLIRPDRRHDLQTVARFQRETGALGELRHPNLIQVTDADEVEGWDFLVMEYVEGIDLGRLLRRVQRLEVADACEVARQAAFGLQYVHDHGLVHRDLKPSNLLLSTTGQLKVLDWGLARRLAGQAVDEGLTGFGMLMGTADFMAPEQGTDPHRVDGRADLYALGCTLYALLTGRPPFGTDEFDTHFKKIQAHLSEPVPPVSGLRSGLPEGLADLVHRLLAKDPSSRPERPADVAEALASFAVGADLPRLVAGARERAEGNPPVRGETLAPVADTPVPRPAVFRPQGHSRAALWAALLLLTAGVVFAGAYALRSPAPLKNEAGEDPPMKSQKWNRLLTREPVKVFAATDTDCIFDANQERLVLRSNALALYALGAAREPHFTFQVIVSQDAPIADGVGVFFGMQEAVDDLNRPCLRYHLLRLQYNNTPHVKKPNMVIERSVEYFRCFGPIQSAHVNSRPIAAQVVEEKLSGEQIVEVRVTPSRLANVQWGRKTYPELTLPNVNNHEWAKVPYEGRFGLFVFKASAVFRSAQFMPHYGEEDNP
jgi:eukaryotic-like serine/threonine-protein kinase